MHSHCVPVVLILTALTSGFARGQDGRIDPKDGPAALSRPAWEYLELPRTGVENSAPADAPHSFAAGLNQLGAHGWEVVSVLPESLKGRPEPVYLLKRPAARQGPPEKAAGQARELGLIKPSTEVVRLKFARATDVAAALAAVFKGARGLHRIVVDGQTNAVLVSGDDDAFFREARTVIELMDRIAAPMFPPPQK